MSQQLKLSIPVGEGRVTCKKIVDKKLSILLTSGGCLSIQRYRLSKKRF